MNEIEINEYLIKDPLTSLKFRGVVSYDELLFCGCEPSNGIYVVNLDESTGSGSHWVVLNLETGMSEYFDSLGNRPHKLREFLLNRKCDYVYNSEKLQADGSDVCGDYCVLFSFFRSRGITFKEFISFFTNDFSLNDKMVEL